MSPTPIDTIKESPKQYSSSGTHPRHSVTMCALSSVNEKEEDTINNNNEELLKQTRSLSDPMVLNKPNESVIDSVKNDVITTKPIVVSVSTPLVTVSSDMSPLESNSDDDTDDETTNEISKVSSVPMTTVTTQDIQAPRTTRTVGIVTPTQSVKLFQVYKIIIIIFIILINYDIYSMILQQILSQQQQQQQTHRQQLII